MTVRAYVTIRAGDTVRVNGGDCYATHLFPHLDVVFSAVWLFRGQKVRNLCIASGGVRQVLGLQSGLLMADSGAFTFYRKKQPAPSPEQVADVYRMMQPDVGIHTDIPVAFLGGWGQQQLFAPPPPPLAKLLAKNLQLAEECRVAFGRACPGVELLPVAQGIGPGHYAAQVTALSEAGFGLIAVGGLAQSGPARIRSVLAAASQAARDAGVGLHVLGCGRLELLGWISGILASFDCTTPVDDAHRDSPAGRQTYFYWENGQGLEKLRLDRLRAGELKLPSCECPACGAARDLGLDILGAGSSQVNRLRAAHNQAVWAGHAPAALTR